MRAYLHIGIGKTGTSAIQKFLIVNRHILRRQGLFYPMSAGRASGRHDLLGAYALRDDVVSDSRRIRNIDTGSLASFRKELEQNFAAEMAGLNPEEIRAAILSDEGLCSIRDQSEIMRLNTLIAGYFDEIKVVIYIRRQDLNSVSQHSQQLKAGRVGRKPLREHHYYAYDELIELWASVYGHDNIIVRVFERSKIPGGDAVRDFLEVCGVQPDGAFTYPGNTNESLSPQAAGFLMHLNWSMKKIDGNGLNLARRKVMKHLLASFPGKGLRPARKAARRFYEQYSASNEAVRMKWFPEEATLFDENFDNYPDFPDLKSIDSAALMGVATSVIEHLSSECVALEDENRRLKEKLGIVQESRTDSDADEYDDNVTIHSSL